MTQLANQDAFAFHKATGCPLARAIDILLEMEPLLRERVIEASHKPKRSLVLRDPIETHAVTAELVLRAAKEAEEIVRQRSPLRRGSAHAIWHEQARILAEKHQIVWFSPQQMNPGVFFD
jgi:hypothetical protein